MWGGGGGGGGGGTGRVMMLFFCVEDVVGGGGEGVHQKAPSIGVDFPGFVCQIPRHCGHPGEAETGSKAPISGL
jgi:hypothetical protein